MLDNEGKKLIGEHALEEDVSRSAYALRALKLLRAQLPRADHAEPVDADACN